MAKLLLHKRTKVQMQQFVAHPGHAVLIVGPAGIGKTSLAHAVIEPILGLKTDTLRQHPYFTLITSDKGTISIDAVRELRRATHLKTAGTQTFRRAILIEHAEDLTIEAQNACLKLLEEPPADTLIVLTATSQQSLLPTILSRVQLITAYVPEEHETKAYFAAKYPGATAIEQAYFLSGGCTGLMTALLDKSEEHPLVRGVATAKDILKKPLFERLLLVDALSKQKDEARLTLEALQRIAQTGVQQATAKEDSKRLKQWHRILKASVTALSYMNANANTKLVLSDLMIRI